jgi:hypothetical protein
VLRMLKWLVQMVRMKLWLLVLYLLLRIGGGIPGPVPVAVVAVCLWESSSRGDPSRRGDPSGGVLRIVRGGHRCGIAGHRRVRGNANYSTALQRRSTATATPLLLFHRRELRVRQHCASGGRRRRRTRWRSGPTHRRRERGVDSGCVLPAVAGHRDGRSRERRLLCVRHLQFARGAHVWFFESRKCGEQRRCAVGHGAALRR